MGEYTTEEIDQKLALLVESERRALVRILQESEADRVSTREIVHRLQESDLTRDEDDHIAIAVCHNHLPKFDAADVVEYDSASEMVRYDGDELVETLLESISEIRRTAG